MATITADFQPNMGTPGTTNVDTHTVGSGETICQVFTPRESAIRVVVEIKPASGPTDVYFPIYTGHNPHTFEFRVIESDVVRVTALKAPASAGDYVVIRSI